MGMKPCDLRPEHIAEAVGIPLGRLFVMADEISRFYKPTRKTYVRGGKVREFDVPKFWFKGVLKRLHKYLQKSFRFHPTAHGGIRGRSCFTAANAHLGKFALATRDVSDCFPSITTNELKKRLLNLGFQSRTAFLLARLLSHKNRVPQGSPTSNDALNIFLFDVDEKASRACGCDATYTRAADDHVVTSNSVEKLAEICALVEEEVTNHGLAVNEKKREKNGLVLSPRCQLVHSIVVNHPRGTRINPAYVTEYMELAYRYLRAARSLYVDSFEGVARLRRRLAGCANYCRQAHFSPAKTLTRLLKTGDRIVERKLADVGVTRSKKWWVNNPKRNRTKKYAGRWRAKEVGFTEKSCDG